MPIPTPFLSLADYKRLFAKLDADARTKIVAAWGSLMPIPPSAPVTSPCASRTTAD